MSVAFNGSTDIEAIAEAAGEAAKVKIKQEVIAELRQGMNPRSLSYDLMEEVATFKERA